MAIWQIDYEGLPQTWLVNAPGELRRYIDQDGCLNTEEMWDSTYDCKQIGRLLDVRFRKGETWHAQLQIWQVKDDTKIEVICQNSLVRALRIRLDVRSLDEKLLSPIVQFANEARLCFFSYKRRIVLPAELECIWQDVNNSSLKGATQ